MLLLHKAITPPHRDTRVLHHGSQVHTYVRPLLTRRRLRLCCQYALLDSESAELVRQLVSGTMLSAISTSAISRAQKKLARRAAIDGFVTTAARLFQVNDKDELQVNTRQIFTCACCRVTPVLGQATARACNRLRGRYLLLLTRHNHTTKTELKCWS